MKISPAGLGMNASAVRWVMNASGNSRSTIVDHARRITRAVSASGTETYKRGPTGRIRPSAFRRASFRRSVLFAPGNRMGGRASSLLEAREWPLVRPVLLGDVCSETGGKERGFTERFLVRLGKTERF
jgi:hypothetical protein